jgi:hypothetical protein
VGVSLGSGVSVIVGEAVGREVSVDVTVEVRVGSKVLVLVGRAVDVTVEDGVPVRVAVAVRVRVRVAVRVAVEDGVLVGTVVAVKVEVGSGGPLWSEMVRSRPYIWTLFVAPGKTRRKKVPAEGSTRLEIVSGEPAGWLLAVASSVVPSTPRISTPKLLMLLESKEVPAVQLPSVFCCPSR